MNDLERRLAELVGDQAGGDVIVQRITPLAGGASRESSVVVLSIQSGPEAGDYELVMRRDLHSEMQPDALSRKTEFSLLKSAQEAGIMVPRPRWYGEIERPLFLMDRVVGESIGSRIVRLSELEQARAQLPRQMGRQLAMIHALEGDFEGLPSPELKMNPAQHAIGRLRSLADQIGIQNPAYEFAFRWLEAHAPTPEAITLVHGDYRIGNMIVGPEGLLAIVDWEFAHLGDPAEDLAWPCVRDWRFGNDALGFGGVGSKEDFLAAYVQGGGAPFDLQAIEYWDILGNVRWAVGCQSQAYRHLSGEDPGVELASLGRRAAEMELDFLRLIEAAEEG
ncbi:MAG: phosphotransferase family protein [Anaerolineales bacterium]